LLNLDPVKVGFESRSVDGRRFLHAPLCAVKAFLRKIPALL
jgi:hypothetical protein